MPSTPTLLATPATGMPVAQVSQESAVSIPRFKFMLFIVLWKYEKNHPEYLLDRIPMILFYFC